MYITTYKDNARLPQREKFTLGKSHEIREIGEGANSFPHENIFDGAPNKVGKNCLLLYLPTI
jgi:hypothetical protein